MWSILWTLSRSTRHVAVECPYSEIVHCPPYRDSSEYIPSTARSAPSFSRFFAGCWIHETSSISDYQFHSLFRFIIHSHVRVIPGLHKVSIRYTNSLIAVFISTDFQQMNDQFLVARYKNSWIFLNIIMNMYLPLFSAKHNNPGKIKKTKTLSMIIKGIYREVRTHSTLLKNALLYEIYI